MVCTVEQEIADPKRFWDERCPKTAIALPGSGDPPVQSALLPYLGENGLRGRRRRLHGSRGGLSSALTRFEIRLRRFPVSGCFVELFWAQ